MKVLRTQDIMLGWRSSRLTTNLPFSIVEDDIIEKSIYIILISIMIFNPIKPVYNQKPLVLWEKKQLNLIVFWKENSLAFYRRFFSYKNKTIFFL